MTASGDGFAVTGSHTYTTGGTFTVTVYIADHHGAPLQVVHDTVSVASPPPPPPPPPSTCPTEPTKWIAANISNDYKLDNPKWVLNASGQPTSSFTQTLHAVGPVDSDKDYFAITANGCWQYNGDPESGGPYGYTVHFSTIGAVDLNGVYLVPVDDGTELVVGDDGSVTALAGLMDQGGRLVTTGTKYAVEIPEGGNPGAPLVIVGSVDLGANPWTFDQGSNDTDHIGSFGPSPQGPKIAGQGINGGDIWLTTPGAAHLRAYLPLPKEFSTGPSTGGPPTADIDYSLTGDVEGNGSGGGGSGGLPQPPAPPPDFVCQAHPHAPGCRTPIYFQSPDRRPHAAPESSPDRAFHAAPDYSCPPFQLSVPDM